MLTVPWETRCEEAYERKKGKYTELVDLCIQRGWRTWLFPAKVGVRGSCSQSICRLMTAVGTIGREKRKAIQKLSQASERASSCNNHFGPIRYESVHGLKGLNIR